MATISISGTNKLAERIISEAEADALKTREEAEATIRSIMVESEKAVSRNRAELASKRESTKKILLNGFKTRTSLDGRKSALSKKRAVIDEAFTRAYQAVLALSDTQRKQICSNMLRAEAEGVETIVPAKADRKSIEAILSEMTETQMTLSKEDANIDGGFLLISKGYEKDCSFASLLSVIRGDEETNVANLLFD